jgi:SnoaL-like domain
MTDDARRISDLVEIEQVCSRYMLLCAQLVGDRWLEVFAPDATYNVFGSVYGLDRFPALLEAAPRGQFIGNMPVVDLDGDRASGKQHFVFIDQTTHAMRLGWYNDEYVRTGDGWRIQKRSTTFMRKHGGFDSGIAHDPLADDKAGGKQGSTA